MEKAAETLPMSTQEGLKKEISDLKERVANREAENQKIMKDIEGIKKENKNLEGRIDCLAAMVKVLEKEEEQLQELLREREDTRATLEAQNQTLAETNQVLRSEIQTISHDLVRFQDYRASRDQNMLRMKQVVEQIAGYFGQLEAEIATAELRYADQKQQSTELKSTIDQLQKICDVQENEILCLEEQLEPFSFDDTETGDLFCCCWEWPSLLFEMVQAKLKLDSQAMRETLLVVLSRGAWVLVGLIVGLVFSKMMLCLMETWCFRGRH
ncbi:uncharacterized protein LOC113431091 [Notechis scutatus]|uniref:Uncharacterized protein LOC113431091 n=1 Tax=Notechis scutatus TaxID=8663 RepID=A0A6J1W1U4_9SAUR|nr:uncharacterized protein LOC113431091 [Notechis scutatus]